MTEINNNRLFGNFSFSSRRVNNNEDKGLRFNQDNKKGDEQITVNPDNYKKVDPEDVYSYMNQAANLNKVSFKSSIEKRYDISKYVDSQQMERIRNAMKMEFIPEFDAAVDEVESIVGLTEGQRSYLVDQAMNG